MLKDARTRCAQAERVFEGMLSDGIEPQTHTFGAICAAYAKSGHVSKAIAAIEQMEDFGALLVEDSESVSDVSMAELPAYC